MSSQQQCGHQGYLPWAVSNASNHLALAMLWCTGGYITMQLPEQCGPPPSHREVVSGQADAVAKLCSHWCGRVSEAGEAASLCSEDISFALAVASGLGHVAVANALITAGANVNVVAWPEEAAFTPLMLASANGHNQVVSLLLRRGADVLATTKNGSTCLELAAEAGHASVTQLLLAAGACPRHGTSLIQACAHNHAAVVDLLLAAGADVNVHFRQGGMAVLTAACQHASPPLVQRLLAAGADVNAAAADGGTALSMAACMGGLEAVRLLLAAGASPDGSSLHPGLPLRSAAQQGHMMVVAALLDAGADPDVKGADGVNPWEAAAQGVMIRSLCDGREELMSATQSTVQAVRRMLEEASAKRKVKQRGSRARGATKSRAHRTPGPGSAASQPEVQTSSRGDQQSSNECGTEAHKYSYFLEDRLILGRRDMVTFCPPAQQSEGTSSTSCQLAVALWGFVVRGYVGGVRSVLAAGCDVNTRNQNGSTALMVALLGGVEEVVSELCASGADVNAADSEGATALFVASRVGRRSVVQTLIQAGATVDVTCHQEGRGSGVTPLMVACRHGHQDTAADLIKAGAGVRAATSSGITCLLEAVASGNAGVVQVLLDAGASAGENHGATGNQTSALLMACDLGQTSVVEVLLAAGALADVPSSDGARASIKEGGRALMAACRQGRLAVADRLLAAGVDVNMAFPSGTTALSSACLWGQLAMVEGLLAAGAAVDGSELDPSLPLRFAAQQGHADIVAALLSAGADPDLADIGGHTAWEYAAAGAHPHDESEIDFSVKLPLQPSVLLRVHSLLEEAGAKKHLRKRSTRWARPAARGHVHQRQQQQASASSSQPSRTQEEADRIAAELIAQEEGEKQAAAAKASKRAGKKAGKKQQGGGSAGQAESQGWQGSPYPTVAPVLSSSQPTSEGGTSAEAQPASQVEPASLGLQQPARVEPQLASSVSTLSLQPQQQWHQQDMHGACPAAFQGQPQELPRSEDGTPGQPSAESMPWTHQACLMPVPRHCIIAEAQQQRPSQEDTSCVVCMEGRRTAVLVPCGHVVLCDSCCESIQQRSNECPMCREPIEAVVRLCV